MEVIDDQTLEKLKEIARSTAWQFDQVRSQYIAYHRHGTHPIIIEVMKLISEEIEKQQSYQR